MSALKLPKYLLDPLLTNIINEYICDGDFSDNISFKQYKSLSQEIGENPTTSRPHSGLIYLSIIFEKSAVRKTERLFYHKQLVESATIRFRNNHSTSLTMTDLYEDLLQNLDKKVYHVRFS